MTLCELITNPITRMVEEGKNLDEIAEAICPSIQYGRQKIIRVIKDFLGEKYLIEHAEVLGYDVGKAQLAKKRTTRSHKKIDATTDTVVESNSVTPLASCQTTEKVARTEHEEEVGQTEGQVLEEDDKHAACCQAVRKVRKIDSEIENESGEMTEPEKILEELDVAPELNVPNELLEAVMILIEKFSIENVKKAIAIAPNYL